MLWPVSLFQHTASRLPTMADAMPDIVAMAQGFFPNCTPSGVALFASLIGSISLLWGLWLQAKLRHFKHRAKMDLAAADLARSFKKALLTGAAEGAVVLKARGREQQYYGEGKALYES
jgi:hypothetical protein